MSAPSDPKLPEHQRFDNGAPPAAVENHILTCAPSVGKPAEVGTMAICPEYFPGTTEKGSVKVDPGCKVSDLVLPVALPPPEPKFWLPVEFPEAETLAEEEVPVEEEVPAVEEVLTEVLVLPLDADPSQGFQEVTTQSSPEEELTAVLAGAVADTDVLDPIVTTQESLPVLGLVLSHCKDTSTPGIVSSIPSAV